MVKKIILGIVIGLVAIILIVLISLPSIIRNYIESNSDELIGRKISIEKINFNYFNGGIRVKELMMFEKDQETLFFGFDELYARLKIWKILSGKYVITKVELSHPKVNIIMFENQFNFGCQSNTSTYLAQMKSIRA